MTNKIASTIVMVLLVAGSACATAKGKRKTYPVVSPQSCSAICGRLWDCGVKPLDSKADCESACEGANEDAPEAYKTYSCVAKATTCEAVKRCSRNQLSR